LSEFPIGASHYSEANHASFTSRRLSCRRHPEYSVSGGDIRFCRLGIDLRASQWRNLLETTTRILSRRIAEPFAMKLANGFALSLIEIDRRYLRACAGCSISLRKWTLGRALNP